MTKKMRYISLACLLLAIIGIAIVLWQNHWTSSFVASLDADYLTGKLIAGTKFTKHNEAYVKRIAATVIAALKANWREE